MKQLELFETEEERTISEMENFISEMELQIKKLEEQELFFEENNAFDWELEFPQLCNNDGEWTGFDVVIGNPPYISAVDMARTKAQKDFFKTNFPEATGAYDIFILFLQKATALLKQNGFYAWIIPNKFLAAQYAKNTKEMLLHSGLSFSVDISHLKIFEKANVYPIIIFGKNKSEKSDFKQFRAETGFDLLSNNIKEYKKLAEYKTFKEFGIKIKSGATGFEAQKLKPFISYEPTAGSIPFVVSGGIDKYSITYENVRYMGTTFSKAFIHNNQKKIAATKWNFWNNKKIVVAGMTKKIEASWAETPLAIGVGTYGIYEFGMLEPKFLLALLNSSFMTYYVMKKFKDKHLADGYLSINKNMIEEFPLIDVQPEQQQPIIKLVDKIIEMKNENSKNDIKNIENEIDKLVFKLYKVPPIDIKMIDNE